MEYKLLGECCSKIGSGATPKGGAMVYVNDGVSFIRSQNVYNDGFAYEGLAQIVDEAAEKLRSVTVAENDVLINITGDSVARCCCVPVNVLPARVNQHVAILRAKSDVVDYRYLHYSLVMPSMQQYLLGIAHSQGASRGALTKGFLEKLALPLPPLPTQRKIAKVLSVYDDLIENNTKRIRILERMAEELYKEWFVRFRFPGHEKAKFVNGLPEGWRESRCGEVIDFDPMTRVDRGRQLTMVPMAALSTKMMSLDASQFTIVENASGSKFRNGDTLLAKITPCLENGKTAYVYGLDDGEVAVGSTEFVVMRGREIGPRLCYCIARSDWFRAIAIGSMSGADGRQRVKVEKLRQAVISLPSNELLEKFESVLSPMFNEVEKLTRQNALLARQRDLLLPRLMSGKLSVEGVG